MKTGARYTAVDEHTVEPVRAWVFGSGTRQIHRTEGLK